MFIPLHDSNPIRHVQFPVVTYGLIAVTVLVFVFQVSLPPYRFDEMAIGLGMTPVVVRDLVDPQVIWVPDQLTLVTYAFLHADWLHLLSNMLFLWVFGDNIEDAMGHVKFLVFYLACAILAALAHMAFNFQSFGPLIGASGAVAGVMGAYIVLFPHARVYVLFKIVVPIPLPIPALWMLAAWFGIQLFYAVTAGDAPVAWWAHIGGMAAGALLAVPFKRREVMLFGGR